MSSKFKKVLEKKQILRCAHCNHDAPHQIKYIHEYTDWIPDWPQEGEDMPLQAYHFLVVCDRCSEISLYSNWDGSDFPFELSQGSLIYPKDKTISGAVPKDIRDAYQEASRISKLAPNAYACMIRKAIEFMCKDKSAKGKSLKEKLQDLSKKGIVPPVLAEMTDIIRYLGNIGAHADSTTLESDDVEAIDSFFNAVIEYVYVAPDKLSKVKEKRIKKTKGK